MNVFDQMDVDHDAQIEALGANAGIRSPTMSSKLRNLFRDGGKRRGPQQENHNERPVSLGQHQ